jgi:hypothetical protein
LAKLTIEIDMDDPQEVWDALYRRIEDFDTSELEDPGSSNGKGTRNPRNTLPATYDLLLDPEQAFGDAHTFFGIFSRND